ncbi:class F sortase [Streptomyces sp. NPDC005963]|uniref:class F sortase n=1 Tax=Streptomyces sp. NPDC005963 TaxID=3156721 RepID=UPI00340DBB82
MISALSRRRSAPALTALLAALTLLAAAGCSGGRSPEPKETKQPKQTTQPKQPEGAAQTVPPASPVTGGKTADPVSVTIPSIGVDSELMRLGLNGDGTVEVPPADRGMTAGWYTGGSVPGDPGASVIIGHNETKSGPAVFEHLGKLRKGAEIAVRTAAGTTNRFTVTGTESVRKKAFPTKKVYGPTNGRELRLITCSGAYDSEGHTVDNLIVYATLS